MYYSDEMFVLNFNLLGYLLSALEDLIFLMLLKFQFGLDCVFAPSLVIWYQSFSVIVFSFARF